MTELLHVQGELPFSRARYLEYYFSSDMVAYFEQHMEVDAYQLELLEVEGDRCLRTVRVAPRLTLPWWVARGLGARRVSYLETTLHNKDSDVLEWSVLSSVLTDRIRMSGRIVLQDTPRGTCHYTIEGEVDVGFYGMGARIERAVVEHACKAQELSHELTLIYDAVRTRGSV